MHSAISLPDIFKPSCLKLIPFPLLPLNSLFLTVLATPDEYRSEYKIPSPSCRLFTIRTFSKACREKSTWSAVQKKKVNIHSYIQFIKMYIRTKLSIMKKIIWDFEFNIKLIFEHCIPFLRCVPTTRTFDTNLLLVNTWHIIGKQHLCKYWALVCFPVTVSKCKTTQNNHHCCYILRLSFNKLHILTCFTRMREHLQYLPNRPVIRTLWQLFIWPLVKHTTFATVVK